MLIVVNENPMTLDKWRRKRQKKNNTIDPQILFKFDGFNSINFQILQFHWLEICWNLCAIDVNFDGFSLSNVRKAIAANGKQHLEGTIQIISSKWMNEHRQ